MIVGESDVLKRHGGLKIGANLGKKDVNFTTQLIMAQMAKLPVEVRRADGGKLTKPLPDPMVLTADLSATANHIGGNVVAKDGSTIWRLNIGTAPLTGWSGIAAGSLTL